MLRPASALCLVAALAAAACQPPPDDAESRRRAILNGGATDVPEIARLIMHDRENGIRGCTATLLNGAMAVTAAHCVGFWTGAPELFDLVVFAGGPGRHVKILKIVNFGADAGKYLTWTQVEDFAAGHLNATPDHQGNDDVAIVFLAEYVALPIYGSISLEHPGDGEAVTTFGYGCDKPDLTGDGVLRFKSWSYTAHPPFSGTASLSNPQDSQALCPGDSGGPAIRNAGGAIWGINSVSGAVFDRYGSAVWFRDAIEAAFQAEVAAHPEMKSGHNRF